MNVLDPVGCGAGGVGGPNEDGRPVAVGQKTTVVDMRGRRALLMKTYLRWLLVCKAVTEPIFGRHALSVTGTARSPSI